MKNESVRTNHIFIDFENVQETELDRIAGKPVKVTFVLGERHKNLPVTLVKLLLKFAGQVALVETGRSGKNALDLVLAQCIGAAKQTDPHGYFHIISKDKDFDPLIAHLKANDTLAARHVAFAEIPVLMNKDERVRSILARLKSKKEKVAKKRSSSESQIQVWFGRALSASELEETINGLVAQKAIVIGAKGEVSYLL